MNNSIYNIKYDLGGAKRKSFIDVSKGILILMMIFGHIGNTAESYSCSNELLYTIVSAERFWTGFFMCAFFVVTGYCSNFEKKFKTYLYSNIRTLLIPSIVISFILQRIDLFINGFSSLKEFLLIDYGWYIYGGGPFWFLSTMFVCKMTYWVVRKITPRKTFRYLIIGILYIFGFSLDYYGIGHNWWYINQALMLLCFLEVGSLLKNVDIKKVGWYSLLFYAVSVGFVFYLTDFGKIGIFRRITIDWMTLVPNFIVAISGSIMTLWFSQKIEGCRILRYIGRNSLIFYCFQEFALKCNWRIFNGIINLDSLVTIIISIMLLFAFTIMFCASYSELIQRTKLKVLIGK